MKAVVDEDGRLSDHDEIRDGKIQYQNIGGKAEGFTSNVGRHIKNDYTTGNKSETAQV